MHKIIIALSLFTLSAEAKDYGKFETKGLTPITLTEAAKKPGEEVLVKANIGLVCQMQGCWMTLEDGATQARVDFAHAFMIPKNTGKKPAIVIGKIKEKEMSMAEARHYAKDAKKSKKEIAAITGPVKSYWIDATGVRIE
jgi:hypothetical protein